MRASKCVFLALRHFIIILSIAVNLTLSGYGQQKPVRNHVPLTQDWSTHHLVFSNPGKFSQAIERRSFLEWYKLQNDPRYQFSLIRRNAALHRGAASASIPNSNFGRNADAHPGGREFPVQSQINSKAQGDWSQFLGGVAGAGINATEYPAKFTFDINAPPDCTNDFVVVAVNVAPQDATASVDGQASIIAFNNLYSGNAVAASQFGVMASNGATSLSSLTINSITLSAVAPTAETATIAFGATLPAGGSSVKLGSITYTFRDAGTIATPTGAKACNVRSHSRSGDTSATVAANLFDAITAGGGNSDTTWECGSSAANSLISATSSSLSSLTISLTAEIPGSTGFTFSDSGATNFVTFSSTAGTDGSTTGLNFGYWSGAAPVSAAQLAANVVTAINNNPSAGVAATLSGDVVTLTALTGGTAGNGITLSSSLPDFTWNGATLVGGMPAGICGSSGPSVMWAYNASTATNPSPMLGSPILSNDGTEVAFIESAGTGAILHVLRWNAGDGAGNLDASPVSAVSATNSTAWSACLAGATACMFNLTLGTHNNTNSPPYYDWASDSLYVGDNSGRLWEVTGVFNGTPTIAPSPWNGLVVDAGKKLTGPVYDFSTGNILVGDSGGTLSLVSPTGAVTAIATGLGDITDAPLVDSSTGMVFAFSVGGGAGVTVTEAATNGSGSPTQLTGLGNSSTGVHVHAGTFDNIYYSSSNSTGNLYVCGKQSAHSAPALYSIGIVAGAMSGVNGGPLELSTTTAGQECSPLTEVFNPNESENVAGGMDWLFVGVPADCAFGGSSTGCIVAFDITSGFPASAFATGAETGGTSGIIEDNVSLAGQTSSVYFTTLASPGAGGCDNEPAEDSTACLVKRTQAGLQ